MTIHVDEAADYARYLPDGLRCNNARERLLCVAETLRVLSDREHPLSNADLRMILVARFGEAAAPAENTLNADIRALRETTFADCTFHTGPSGTWCERTALTPARVRLLFNAVQSSRFLTAEENADLQESLLDLVSIHQEYGLEGDVHVVQRVEPGHQTAVLAACDAIAQALQQDRRVVFEYTFNDFEGVPVPLAGDDGSFVRVETPIALYYSEGNYYLESFSRNPWRHGQHLMRSRVDRMRNVRVSPLRADTCEEVIQARKTAPKRMKTEFQMLSGTRRGVFLRVSAERTNEMFDRFGFGIEFANYIGTPSDKDSTGDIFLTMAQSPTFFRWLAGMGGSIRLVPPPSELALQSQPWKRLCAGWTRDKLMGDYEAMVSAYRGFLDAALRAIE